MTRPNRYTRLQKVNAAEDLHSEVILAKEEEWLVDAGVIIDHKFTAVFASHNKPRLQDVMTEFSEFAEALEEFEDMPNSWQGWSETRGKKYPRLIYVDSVRMSDPVVVKKGTGRTCHLHTEAEVEVTVKARGAQHAKDLVQAALTILTNNCCGDCTAILK